MAHPPSETSGCREYTTTVPALFFPEDRGLTHRCGGTIVDAVRMMATERFRFTVLPILFVSIVLASACSGRRAAVTSPASVPRHTETGLASWYGKAHHGRRTASGERFDMQALTAAHRTLAFGTIVRVTDVASGRSVNVRINDRGPFGNGRIIDLSYAAARKLGMVATSTHRKKFG